MRLLFYTKESVLFGKERVIDGLFNVTTNCTYYAYVHA